MSASTHDSRAGPVSSIVGSWASAPGSRTGRSTGSTQDSRRLQPTYAARWMRTIRTTLVHALAQARSGFAAVEATDEARHDAQAYAAALDAIMAFQSAGTTPLRAAASRLGDAVSR
jgi:hypothetical protein